MFTKETWTVFNIDSLETAFLDKLKSDGYKHMPLLAKSTALHTRGHSLGMAPFGSPRIGDVDELLFDNSQNPVLVDDILGSFCTRAWVYNEEDVTLADIHQTLNLLENDLWQNDPEAWKIADGVYAFWYIGFDWKDVNDTNSKKESVAYSYGSPFKFQPADMKQQITDQVAELDTITREQFQVIVDFNLKRVWVNSANKNTLIEFMDFMASFDVPLLDWRPEGDYGMEPQWTESFLRTLVDNSDYHDEFNARAAEIRSKGVKGVEPEENAFMEKILKNYFAFSPMGDSNPDEFLAFGGPLTVRLAPTVMSTVALRTPYEATELLNDDNQTLLLTSAPMTVCRLLEKVASTGDIKTVLIKDFSIEVTPNTITPEVPGFVIKGLNLENFKNTIKVFVKAHETISIKDYWSLWYYGMNSSLFRYLGLVKETLEVV